MYLELSKQFVFRNTKITSILSAVNLFIILLLTTSLCLSSGIKNSINKLNEDYSIIGVIEYLGEGYPSMINDPDSSIVEAYNGISDLLKDDRILYFQPYSQHFGSIGIDKNLNSSEMTEYAVLEVKITNYQESTHVYNCRVVNQYYSVKNQMEHFILIDAGEDILNEGDIYLVHGKYYYAGAYDAIGLCDFELYDYDQNTRFLNLKDENTDKSVFLSMASVYDSILHSSVIVPSNHIEDLLEFNQSYITLQTGNFPQTGECLISSRIADFLEKSVGDEITINEAIKTNTNVDKMYDGVNLFDRSNTWTISGVYNTTDEYNNLIYIYDDAAPTFNSWTLGQIRIKNADYLDFINQFKLPSNYKITYYDQGYSIIMDGLSSIQNMVSIIAIVCVCVTIAFVFLYAFLLLKAQGNTYKIMVRLGNKKKDLSKYTSFTSLLICFPGIIIGAPVGMIASSVIQKAMLAFINNNSTINYSNFAISVVKDLQYTSPSYLLICAALVLYLLINIVFCLVSINKSMKPNKLSSKTHVLKVKTKTFKNDFSYGLISVIRGEFRSILPILLFVILLIVFTILPNAVTNAKNELSKYKTESEINGFFTSYSGSQYDNLVVFDDVFQVISAMDKVYDTSAARYGNYRIMNVQKENGELTGPGLAPQPVGSFAQETYANHLKCLDHIKAIINVYGASEFLFQKDRVNITWLEGYNNEDLSKTNTTEIICVIPKTIAEEYNCELGDHMILEIMYGDISMSSIYYVKFHVVGIFDDDGCNKTIYTQASLLTTFSEARKYKENESTEIINDLLVYVNVSIYPITTRWYESGLSYQSCSFKVNGNDLDNVKNELLARGYSQPNTIRSQRVFILFNDINFLNTERSLNQKIDYMRFLFPVIYVAAMGIAMALGFESIKSKQNDLRILHNLGASKKTIYKDIVYPQVFLTLAAYLLTSIIIVVNYGFGISMILQSMAFILYELGIFICFKRINVFDRKKVRNEM